MENVQDTFTIIVDLEVKSERLNEFKALIEQDARDSVNKEPTCLRFDILRDPKEENQFTLYEVYQNQQAFQFHQTTPHFALWDKFYKSGGAEVKNFRSLTHQYFLSTQTPVSNPPPPPTESTIADRLNPSSTALLLIEFQNEFVSEGGKMHGAVSAVMEHNSMLKKSVELVETARSIGCKIIHCPFNSPDFPNCSQAPYGILAGVKGADAFKEGSWGSEFAKEMTPKEKDLVVKGKCGPCGFASTNLQTLLGLNQIRTLIIGGFLTNGCVESTMRTAYELGYDVITVTDCTATASFIEQQTSTQQSYPMFSLPLTQQELVKKLQSQK